MRRESATKEIVANEGEGWERTKCTRSVEMMAREAMATERAKTKRAPKKVTLRISSITSPDSIAFYCNMKRHRQRRI